jgi:cyclophilin family peptidyl-prolyl cis-trans isomerase
VTAEKKETSRDTRMALLDRLGAMGNAGYAARLAPLLKDFDIEIAVRTGAVIEGWTGKAEEVNPQPLNRPALPFAEELDEPVIAVVEMENGKKFEINFKKSQTPLAVTRFRRLVRANYYNGLTFHRVLPRFIIQGGSPGANEYVGDGPYMRDEFSPAMSTRGTIGISTRGRDTGDAQFFINLVDNPRLDYEYTIFAAVCGAGMRVVDEIVEGDRIGNIRLEKPDSDSDCR